MAAVCIISFCLTTACPIPSFTITEPGPAECTPAASVSAGAISADSVTINILSQSKSSSDVLRLATTLPPVPSGSGISLAFTGDILLDRGVKKVLDSMGADYPYNRVKEILKASDIVFGNLECPLAKNGAGVLKDKKYIFRADPSNAEKLKQAGFSVLNLANNHSMDCGAEGLAETMEALDKNGIAYAGAGLDKKGAVKPLFIEKGGITTGFLCYSTFPSEGYFYSENSPDTAHPDPSEIGPEIRKARGKCDFLVVSFHWGKEFDFYPAEQQKTLARLAIDNGADIVVGHHPHVLQGVETYKGKLIFYSLGNFIFDRQVPEGTDKSAILRIDLQKGRQGKVQLSKAELLPMVIKNCRPETAAGRKAADILDSIRFYSKGLGAAFDSP